LSPAPHFAFAASLSLSRAAPSVQHLTLHVFFPRCYFHPFRFESLFPLSSPLLPASLLSRFPYFQERLHPLRPQCFTCGFFPSLLRFLPPFSEISYAFPDHLLLLSGLFIPISFFYVGLSSLASFRHFFLVELPLKGTVLFSNLFPRRFVSFPEFFLCPFPYSFTLSTLTHMAVSVIDSALR